ncbi:MAG: hypothetical protein KJ970_05805 [Candidatus Eisenbacteria bacterium]|uniref:Zinc-finger domain-containing protein n=1 Tax=Eiseniibacteriota bacterium TaxID=2212470 RepID=A0A948RY77_UNCEI|nr:hypothetical protein [Candidatus Eisenbacteria bacterium]MBU1949351.1 hypothetical protein [Candidatus Eisenbacteria bacterium]MBU2690424.1 hypothetical protein [Candidatus Eisenbacteria bacterium]
MNCDKYRQREIGEITPDEFARHAETCRICGDALRIDRRIESEAAGLPIPDPTPGLWWKIAVDLEREQIRDRLLWRDLSAHLKKWIRPQHHPVLKIAAVSVLAIGLAFILYPRSSPTIRRNLLTEQALDRAEALENEYVQAIEELELLAQPLIADIDTELRLHYRSRLETIDTQIRRCRAALESDRGNAHIRRYLLTAYQDKQETIANLIRLSEQSKKSPRMRKELEI